MESNFFIGETPRGSSAALPDKTGGSELSRRILKAIATANETLEWATARLIRIAELAYGERRFDELKASGLDACVNRDHAARDTLVNDAALHHEDHSPHGRDVFQRVAVEGNDVCL